MRVECGLFGGFLRDRKVKNKGKEGRVSDAETTSFSFQHLWVYGLLEWGRERRKGPQGFGVG